MIRRRALRPSDALHDFDIGPVRVPDAVYRVQVPVLEINPVHIIPSSTVHDPIDLAPNTRHRAHATVHMPPGS